MNQPDKYLGQRSFRSKLLSAHTHPTECSAWTIKLVCSSVRIIACLHLLQSQPILTVESSDVVNFHHSFSSISSREAESAPVTDVIIPSSWVIFLVIFFHLSSSVLSWKQKGTVVQTPNTSSATSCLKLICTKFASSMKKVPVRRTPYRRVLSEKTWSSLTCTLHHSSVIHSEDVAKNF